ncbi:MAG: dienelactone hydrolase family protein [Chloroflexi bacterium]|nr:dienelactone hydrolase family protein [Chloroflexota bacterium]
MLNKEITMSGETVSFKSNGKMAGGYLAVPASGQGKGVIVIQEWWGLVPHIKDVADRFAKAGFVALAPDLYHGQQTTEPGEAGKLMMAMNIDEAERDLRGAVNFLQSHPGVGGQKVGTVGFCMGGALSLFAASKNPDAVGACVIFYGGHPAVKPDLDRLTAPVLGLYAEKDGFVSPEVVRALEKELASRGKHAEMHIYPNVDHAFFNDERPQVYSRQAAEDAWRRTLAFFNANL